MTFERNLKWRPLPSRIYFPCQFWARDLFPLVAIYISTKFRKCITTGGELLRIGAKTNMATAAIFDFVGSNI